MGMEGGGCFVSPPLDLAGGDFTQAKPRSAPESSSLPSLSSSSSFPVLQERDVLTEFHARLELPFNGHAPMTSADDLPALMVC